MAFQYDINKIFAELEQQARKKKNEEVDESKENNPIESPEDVPETQEVAPATSKTTEDTHGGDEATKEIEDSPNSVNDGQNSDKENKSDKTDGTGEQEKDEKKDEEKDEDGNGGEGGDGSGKGDLKKNIERIFEEKKKKIEDFKTQNRREYLKKYILEIIKKIAMEHAGIDKQDGSETYDKKQMLQHILKYQNYRLLSDKYDLKDARYVQFFIDTSGVYGCGSNKIMHELMPEVISLLEKQGYECYIAACGNGFYSRDMVEDNQYGTRKTLEGYKAGKVSKIACPTPKTAAQMANEAEFSIILADFDGLSSICKMADLCQKDKVPYFLSTEDRYPWENPTLHDWVSPDLYDYNPELIYDVSMDGNPTLEEYENKLYDDYEEDYDEDNNYEQDDYYNDDDNHEYDD